MGKEKTQFKPGNPGKPKGAKNKVNQELRDKISEFLTGNFSKIVSDFNAMGKNEKKDRTRLFIDLLQYGLPKLQATSLELNFEDLTDEQLDLIIDRLKKSGASNEQT